MRVWDNKYYRILVVMGSITTGYMAKTAYDRLSQHTGGIMVSQYGTHEGSSGVSSTLSKRNNDWWVKSVSDCAPTVFATMAAMWLVWCTKSKAGTRAKVIMTMWSAGVGVLGVACSIKLNYVKDQSTSP